MRAPRKTIIVDLFILFSISFVFYLFFMGSYMLLSPDESRYASVSLEMLMRHEWIVPYQNGIVFLDKPILFYWLEIISMKLFGVNEWACRLVPMAFGILGILTTYVGGIYLFNRRTALIASFILMTSPLYFMLSHYVNMDLAVGVLISSSLWFLLLALHFTNKRKCHVCFYISCVFSGLAVLTKGLVGVIFPVMIAGLWVIVFNQWRQLIKMPLLIGGIIILAINAPWYIAAQHANSNFFHYFFIVQHFNRYVSHAFNMANPFYYYGLVLVVGFLPWVVFFPQSITLMVKQLRSYKKAMIEWFLVLWIGIIFIFFSVPPSKVSTYILPIFPPIAMFVARYFDHFWNTLLSKKSTRWSLIVLSAFITLLILAIIFIRIESLEISLPSGHFLASAMLFLILVLAIGYIIKWCVKRTVVFLGYFVFAIMVSILMLYSQMKVIKLQTVKKVAIQMREALTPGAIPSVGLSAYDHAFSFYVRQPVYFFPKNWHDPAILTQDNWEGELARGAQFSNNYRYLLDIDLFNQLWISNLKVVVCIRQSDFQRLKPIFNRKPYRLIEKIDGFYLLTQQ